MKKSYLISSLILVGCALSSCGSKVQGEAYGLSHGGSYVCQATVELKGEKVVDANLIEVCLPDHVTATEASSDTISCEVTAKGRTTTKIFYKTVKFGTHTFECGADGAYKEGEKTLKDFLGDEANCKEYYEAVMNNQISVMVGGTAKMDILCKATLCKEDNGYWTKTNETTGEPYSQWKVNRDASVEFLKSYGIEVCKASVKDATTKVWGTADAVSTATWSDFNSDTTGKGYFSYVQLFEKAINAAK